MRTSMSASLAFCIMANSRFLTLASPLPASALAAARRTAGSASRIWVSAYACASSVLTCGSLSCASALASSGAIAGVGSPASAVASSRTAARRSARSASNSLSVARAPASSPRTRLLMVIESALAGASAISAPEAASNARSPSLRKTSSPSANSASSFIALSTLSAEGSALCASFVDGGDLFVGIVVGKLPDQLRDRARRAPLCASERQNSRTKRSVFM